MLRVILHYNIALTANAIDYTKIPGFDQFAPGFGMNINKAKINILFCQNDHLKEVLKDINRLFDDCPY